MFDGVPAPPQGRSKAQAGEETGEERGLPDMRRLAHAAQRRKAAYHQTGHGSDGAEGFSLPRQALDPPGNHVEVLPHLFPMHLGLRNEKLFAQLDVGQ